MNSLERRIEVIRVYFDTSRAIYLGPVPMERDIPASFIF